MDFEVLNQEAQRRAESVLNSRFDVEAYLIYCMGLLLQTKCTPIDFVENSGVDENIQILLSTFINYTKSLDSSNVTECEELASNLCGILKQIVFELYLTSKNAKIKGLFRQLIGDLKAFIEIEE